MPSITATSRAPEIGAEIAGIDLSEPLTAENRAAIQAAFDTYRLLIFRDQYLTVDQHVAFSEHFGRLEDFPDPKDQAEGHETVLRRHQRLAYRFVVPHPAVEGIDALRDRNAGRRRRYHVCRHDHGL